MGWIALLGKALDLLLSLFGLGKKDERDTERQAGEAKGVAETQAATAQEAVTEAKDAQEIDERVRAESDEQLNAELRNDSKSG